MRKGMMKSVLSVAMAAAMVGSTVPVSAAGNLSEEASLQKVYEKAETAEYIATQGMVLLENDGVLPLSQEKGTKIALFGAGSYGTVPGGSGSGNVYVAKGVESKVYDGFQNAGYDIVNSASLDVLKAEYEEAYAAWTGYGKYVHTEPVYADTEYIASDIAEAQKETDTAVFVISRTSGEGTDRTVTKGDYYLSDIEYQNLSYIASKFENVVVVLNVAEVIDTNFFNGDGNYPADDEYNRGKIDGLDALVLMSQAGEKEGDAVVSVLNGEVNPSGKLTDTWAVDFEDYSSSSNISSMDGVTVEEFYTDDIFVGYRYFDTFGITPAYEFGYGLSYTDFDIDVTSVSADTKNVTVNATVTNTGDMTGKEVVEVYFSAPDKSMAKPYQELATYGKVEVEAGQSKDVTLTFATSDMASYDEAKEEYTMDPGQYVIRVGSSSRNTVEAATISLDSAVVTEEAKNSLGLTAEEISTGNYDPMYVYETETTANPVLNEDSEGYGTGIVPTTEGLTAAGNKLTLKAADFPAAETHTYTNGDTTTYVSSNDSSSDSYAYAENFDSKEAPKVYGVGEETLKEVETSDNYTLVDVVTGNITAEQLVASMSNVELADLVQGDTYAAGDKDDNGGYEAVIGYQADFAFSAAGLTTNNLYTSTLVPQISMSDGPAGVRIPTSYLSCTMLDSNAVYDPDTTYYYYHPYASSTNMAYYYVAGTLNSTAITDEATFNEVMASGTKVYVEEGTRYQYCTAIPVGTCLAQTFDQDVIEMAGRLVASEMQEYGVTLWLAPGMNIHRNPLCGRNFEYYSEDPVVVALTVTAETIGVQTQEDGTASGVGVTIKHFAVNNQENSRFGSNSVLSERAAREIYLAGFEYIVKNADPWAIMSSYNAVNGINTVEHYGLLTSILRDEWGFNGMVMSDWYSYAGIKADSVYGKNNGGNTAQAVQLFAGNDTQMPGRAEAATLKCLSTGELRLGDLQKAAINMLNTIAKSSVFKTMYDELADSDTRAGAVIQAYNLKQELAAAQEELAQLKKDNDTTLQELAAAKAEVQAAKDEIARLKFHAVKAIVRSIRSTAKKTVKVTVKTLSGAKYQIKYSYNKSMKSAKSVRTSSASVVLKNLKSGKTCYVTMRAYKSIAGVRTYTSYSAVKTVKVK